MKKEEYTPMMRQYLDIKEKYHEEILFFRLGDFYEMFFDDALLASKELEIALTGRDAGVKEKVPMCGIPYHAADTYVDKLVQKGYKVAICEQMTLPGGKDIVKREVTRVVTPGLNMNINSLDNYKNNYIASVFLGRDRIFYITYLDITTGETYAFNIEKNYAELIDELIKLNVKEIVLYKTVDLKKLKNFINAYNIIVNISSDVKLKPVLNDLIMGLNDLEIDSYALLTNYLDETQKRSLSHLQVVMTRQSENRMVIDRFSIQNLELIETNRYQQKKGSLFWFLDHCNTAFGSRLLRKEIESPLIKKSEIIKRYNIVEYLIKNYFLRDDLIKVLENVYDLERICAKLAYGNINPKDIDFLKKSVNTFSVITSMFADKEASELKTLINKIYPLQELQKLLNDSINDNPPISIKDLNVIKDGYSKELDDLRYIQKHSNEFLLNLEAKEREKTGIKSLKIGYNRVFGYYFEVLKSQTDLIKDEYGYIRKQTLSNSERYINATLKDQEAIILNALESQEKLEIKLFSQIKKAILKYIRKLQSNAKILALLDMLISFSIVSESENLVKPVFTDDDGIEIIEGRHPVVEKLLNEEFVKNDILMDNETITLLITGPNMSGKSTYMRQFALIAIMAQIGCFVPAKTAKIKLFDRIFTRIGASDDLISGQSTFMIEMLEVNYALKNATKNSLILFDEIGRGTSTYDGIALAQAILEYINNKIKCKTLFSTHYHELVTLENYLGTVKNVHVHAKEEKGNVVFYHKIVDGPVDKSYGINVAKLAHMPKEVIKRAKVILNNLEKENTKINLFSPDVLGTEVVEVDNTNYELLERIKNIDVENMSMKEALDCLYELVMDVRNDYDNKKTK